MIAKLRMTALLESADKQPVKAIKKTAHHESLGQKLLVNISLVVAAAGACLMYSPLLYAGGDSKSSKAPASSGSESPGLTGQELYAIHCSRCHSERYPTEFTAAHWRTIMTHMRVRANLPAEQAREILKYLEQDAGS
jgi:mono/diheme cytochrome c family protein